MLIIATISDMRRMFIVLDSESGEVTSTSTRPEFFHARPDGAFPCRPFGITWNDEQLLVANHTQILAFGRNLRYLRTIGSSLQINIHQIAWHEERVWAVSPRTNSLISCSLNSNVDSYEFDLVDQKTLRYIPRFAAEHSDIFHFNSILFTDEHLIVSAHNFNNPSFINCYNKQALHLDFTYYGVGTHIHGLAKFQNELFWLDTGSSRIRSSKNASHLLTRKGYCRGFGVTEQYFVVGISETFQRDGRRLGDSWIQIIERESGDLLREFHIIDSGGINDLRLLDVFDYAHGVQPFLKPK